MPIAARACWSARPIKWIEENRKEDLLTTYQARDQEQASRGHSHPQRRHHPRRCATLSSATRAPARDRPRRAVQHDETTLPGPYRLPGRATRPTCARPTPTRSPPSPPTAPQGRGGGVLVMERLLELGGAGRSASIPSRSAANLDPLRRVSLRGGMWVRDGAPSSTTAATTRRRCAGRSSYSTTPAARPEQARRAPRAAIAASASAAASSAPGAGPPRAPRCASTPAGARRDQRRAATGPGPRDHARPDLRRGGWACAPTTWTVLTGDTAAIGCGMGPYASRGTAVVAGNATSQAAFDRCARRRCGVAAQLLEAAPSGPRSRGRRDQRARRSPTASLPLAQIARTLSAPPPPSPFPRTCQSDGGLGGHHLLAPHRGQRLRLRAPTPPSSRWTPRRAS